MHVINLNFRGGIVMKKFFGVGVFLMVFALFLCAGSGYLTLDEWINWYNSRSGTNYTVQDLELKNKITDTVFDLTYTSGSAA